MFTADVVIDLGSKINVFANLTDIMNVKVRMVVTQSRKNYLTDLDVIWYLVLIPWIYTYR